VRTPRPGPNSRSRLSIRTTSRMERPVSMTAPTGRHPGEGTPSK
jgi:hypothetical protein